MSDVVDAGFVKVITIYAALCGKSADIVLIKYSNVDPREKSKGRLTRRL